VEGAHPFELGTGHGDSLEVMGARAQVSQNRILPIGAGDTCIASQKRGAPAAVFVETAKKLPGITLDAFVEDGPPRAGSPDGKWGFVVERVGARRSVRVHGSILGVG